MTKQSTMVLKQGFMTFKTLVQKNILSLILAITMLVGGGMNTFAHTLDFPKIEIAQKLSGSTAVITLNPAIPGGSVTITENAAFFAAFPGADFFATLDATGTQLAATLTNGPSTGTYTIGRINVFDSKDVFVGSALAKVKDGVVELVTTDF